MHSNFEDKYKRIFNTAIMGIYQIDLIANKFVTINPGIANIFGFPTVEDLLESEEVFNAFCFKSFKRKELLKQLSNENEIVGYESEITLPNGSKIWISESIKALSHNGKIEQVIGTVKDITERKHAVENLKLAKDDWERTFDAIEEVIIILDKELKIRRLNKAALKEYNVFTDNAEGVFCNNLYRIGESHCSTCPARATVFDHKPHSGNVVYESLGKTFQTSSSPIMSETGEFLGVVFIAKNISEEIKLKKESEYRMQQVIQADKLKSLGELVANVAHEINNPNSFIVHNISLLERSWKLFRPMIDESLSKISDDEHDKQFYEELADEMGELIDSVKIGSKRIKNVVSNLKDFAKADQDNFAKISINEVIAKAMTIIESKIKKSFSNFIVNYGDNIPKLWGDSRKLEQVIVNLIVNAMQARRDQENSLLEISTKYIERLNAVTIEVYDNGRGFGQEIKSKLFQPFFTTRSKDGGSGLGLSISKEIVEKHNGIIDVHSKENSGTKFKIYLPVEEGGLKKLSSRILCVDGGNSIFNEDIVCFLGDSRNPMQRVQGVEEIAKHIFSHPEVDIILINLNIIEHINSVIKELKTSHPLLEVILFDDKDEPFGIREFNGIKLVSSEDKKQVITKINELLRNYN